MLDGEGDRVTRYLNVRQGSVLPYVVLSYRGQGLDFLRLTKSGRFIDSSRRRVGRSTYLAARFVEFLRRSDGELPL